MTRKVEKRETERNITNKTVKSFYEESIMNNELIIEFALCMLAECIPKGTYECTGNCYECVSNILKNFLYRKNYCEHSSSINNELGTCDCRTNVGDEITIGD